MSGIIRIDMPKGIEEGSTSVAPQSPRGGSVASPPISGKGLVLLGYSAMAVKATYNTAMQEIRAGGNEELATGISNAVTGASIVLGAIATKGLSLIPLGVSAASQLVTREFNNNRRNRAKEYELSMRGSRVNYTQGGGYE